MNLIHKFATELYQLVQVIFLISNTLSYSKESVDLNEWLLKLKILSTKNERRTDTAIIPIEYHHYINFSVFHQITSPASVHHCPLLPTILFIIHDNVKIIKVITFKMFLNTIAQFRQFNTEYFCTHSITISRLIYIRYTKTSHLIFVNCQKVSQASGIGRC